MTPLVLVRLLMSGAAQGVSADAPLPPPLRESHLCTVDGSRWPYLIEAPEGGVRAILVYLHGHYADETQGMTEGSYNDAFGKLRRECRTRGIAYVSAWYGGNTWMGPVAEAGLADLIGVLRARWPGQPVYLCGGSMGGSSTLVFAARRPELLAGAIALCPAADIESYYDFAAGSENPTLQNIAAAIALHYQAGESALREELAARSALRHAERLTMPLYLAHGSADALIPVEATRRLSQRLTALGRPVKYVEIDGGDHDSPVTQMDWPAALDWVLAPH